MIARIRADYVNCTASGPIFNYTKLDNNDKSKPAERRGRKTTGPRFLRGAACDAMTWLCNFFEEYWIGGFSNETKTKNYQHSNHSGYDLNLIRAWFGNKR